MRSARSTGATGATSVEACLVAGLLVAVLLAGPLDVPRALTRALGVAMDAFVSAIDAELP